MRLLLVRHGQTPHNITGALDTAAPGAGLSRLGQRQAQAVPDALAGEDVVAVYASPLRRAQQSAAPLAERLGLDVRVRDGLEEISAGDLELRTDDDAVEQYAGALAHWMGGRLDHHLPGSADGHAFHDRYDRAVRGIVADHDAGATVVVFSHGAAIRAYVALATDMPEDRATGLRLQNTGLGLLVSAPGGGWRLERWSSEPLGGPELADDAARDVTGETTDEAADQAADQAADEVA